jgi:hypothetical protein
MLAKVTATTKNSTGHRISKIKRNYIFASVQKGRLKDIGCNFH